MLVYDTVEEAMLPPGTKTCIALGLFQGLHRGHRRIIERVAAYGGGQGLLPALFTMDITKAKPAAKSGLALFSFDTQAGLLEEWGIQCLFCPPFSSLQGMEPDAFAGQVLAKAFGASAVCCGENFRFGKGAGADAEDLYRLGRKYGFEVMVEPLLLEQGGAVSSTRIRQQLEAGAVEQAARLLGRPYQVDFTVVRGRQLGRTIGSPTINQPYPPGFVVPRFGVYATIAAIGGKRYPAVTNVGVKPTVGSEGPLAETCIAGFTGDLYGRRVPVAFHTFLRLERKFGSVEELRAQIQQDLGRAVELTGPLCKGNGD